MSQCDVVHKPIPIPKAMNILEAKALSRRNGQDCRSRVQVTSQAEVIRGAKLEGKKVHFATLMDLCHLKNSALEKNPKYIGKVVLRGDIVKDDSGNYAAFTEQGASASKKTAAKVWDVISRLIGCS